jgi:hypothetical protein
MMKLLHARLRLALTLAISTGGLTLAGPVHADPVAFGISTQAKPAVFEISNGSLPLRVLVQSPAETVTELQVICLFQSIPANALHGSLIEINQKLNGLLDRIRGLDLFRGELGETILIIPPAGSMNARRLLIIGLGGAQTFAPQRMELVGSIVYREAQRMGVVHPFFAPTILDGGVTKFTTGEVSQEVASGFLRAARAEKILQNSGASTGHGMQDLTFLAGPSHASDTQQGIEKAIAADAAR